MQFTNLLNRVTRQIATEPGTTSSSIINKVKQAARKAHGLEETATKLSIQEYKYSPATYLQSNDWIDKVQLVINRDKGLCQGCLRKESTAVYHKSKSYQEFTGNEHCFDLVSVCRDCEKLLQDE